MKSRLILCISLAMLLVMPVTSFAVPPLERVKLLTDTVILDISGNEIDTVTVGQQAIIATPSFTMQLPLGVNWPCGKTIVQGDELVCVGNMPTQQTVEGDKLIGESRFNQHAVSITQIKDEEGTVVHLSWIEGVLESDHVMLPTVSWIPEKPGTYSVTTYFWESVNNPTALAPPIPFEVTVV